MGTGFDCASAREIELILNLGVEPSRIIFANPCKAASSITFARSRGIRKMTFDNKDELYKIRDLYPEAKLLLRIFADDKSSLCRLGQKFGAKLDSTI
jgi:ornithine decarboxylase